MFCWSWATGCSKGWAGAAGGKTTAPKTPQIRSCLSPWPGIKFLRPNLGSIPHLQTWCNLQCQCGCVFDYLGQDVVEKCFRFADLQFAKKLWSFNSCWHINGQFNVCKLTWSPFKGSKFPFGRVYLRWVCLAVAMDLDSNELMQKIYAHFEGVQGSTMHCASYDLAFWKKQRMET